LITTLCQMRVCQRGQEKGGAGRADAAGVFFSIQDAVRAPCTTTPGRACVKPLRSCLHGICPQTPPHAPAERKRGWTGISRWSITTRTPGPNTRSYKTERRKDYRENRKCLKMQWQDVSFRGRGMSQLGFSQRFAWRGQEEGGAGRADQARV
jgi:hypothetical protein